MAVSVSIRLSDKPDATTITFSGKDGYDCREELISALRLGDNLMTVELLGVVVEAEQVVRAVRTAAHGLGASVLPHVGPTDLTQAPKTSADDVKAYQVKALAERLALEEKQPKADAKSELAEPSAANVEAVTRTPTANGAGFTAPAPTIDPVKVLLLNISEAMSVKHLTALYGANKALWSNPEVSAAAKARAKALARNG